MFQWYSMHDPGAPLPCIPIMDQEIADLLRGELSDWLIGTID